jgi:hypothetical protein
MPVSKRFLIWLIDIDDRAEATVSAFERYIGATARGFKGLR